MRNRLAEYLRTAPLWISFLINMAVFGAVQAGFDAAGLGAFYGPHRSMLHIVISIVIFAAITTSVTTGIRHLGQRPAPADADEEPRDDREDGVDP